MDHNTIILGLETSCDETSASVIINGSIMSNIIATQPIHASYGGVIPELASRAHEKNIIPCVTKALSEAKVEKNMLNAIAFTQGPGLLGALMVGINFGKSLALSLNIPIISVNHMQAHIMALFIDDPIPQFPFICLTVSGGHTQIVLVSNLFTFTIIGETIDDAVGEAFDKSAKLLQLPYPGGPLIDQQARAGNPFKYNFPIPNVPDLNFSFSGIKTSIMYFLKENTKQDPDFIRNNLPDICASIQFTLIDILMRKLIKAAQKYNIKNIAIAGGVANNSELRNRINTEKINNNWTVFMPKPEYCSDNAAMVAKAAYYRFLNKEFSTQNVSPKARLSLNE